MADDFALGSVLVIPPTLITNLEKVDKYIESIQNNTKSLDKLSGVFKNFDSANLSSTAENLGKIVDKLNSLSTTTVGTSLQNASEQAQNLAGSITQASENIDKLNNKKVTVTYDGAISTADSAASIKERTEAMRQLMQVRENLKTTDTDYATKMQTLNAKIAEMNRLNREAVQTEQEKQNQEDKAIRQAASHTRALASQQSAQAAVTSATARQINAETRLANAQQRAATANARNVTDPQEALQQAAVAKSIEQRTLAIKALESARNKLSTDDANYKATLDQLNAKIKELNQSNKEAIAGSKALAEQYNSLGAIAERMGKRMLIYFGLDYLKDFANKIVEVRGNFELQQRSLEAILQDKNKADQIFAQTVQLAVKSPFQIQDLVTYTKQLAAYRIETDKLHDTTKRLADVSAGLGVDMQRLILAYGQVKAAAYLRGTEVRQFTEAGINMYGELQKYFEEVKGEAYSTAQIVDMISKRMVTFEDVEAVFKRLTDQGGIFYNMQALQAETLSGKISNLKDSFDIMYNEMGKGNEGMLKGAIDAVGTLIRHWKELAEVLKLTITIFSAVKVQAMFANSAMTEWVSTFRVANTFGKQTMVWNALGTAIKGVGNALKASLPGLAIYAALETITTVYNKVKEYNEAMRKATTENLNMKSSLYQLTRTMQGYVNVLNNVDASSTYKDDAMSGLRKGLYELRDMLQKEGFEVNINVPSLNEDQIIEEYNKAKGLYEQYIADMLQIRRAAAKDDQWNGWYTLSDTIDEDAQDYSNAVTDAIGQMGDDLEGVNKTIESLSVNYSTLSDDAKKYYDQIQAMAGDEKDINYYRKVYDLITKIDDAEYSNNGYNRFRWLSNAVTIFGNSLVNVQKAEAEFDEHLDKMYAHIDKSDKHKLKVEIDKDASDRSWDDYQRQHAYDHFEIKADVKVEANTHYIEGKLRWVDSYIRDFFAHKKYTVNISTAVGKNLPNQEFTEAGDLGAESAKYWEEQGKRYGRMLQKGITEIPMDSQIAKILGYDMAGDFYKGTKVSIQRVIDQVNVLKKEATDYANAFGVDPFEKNLSKSTPKVVDYLSLQISALEAMQKKYEELRKVMSDEAAQNMVQAMYSTTLKSAKTPESIINSYVPTKEGLVAALNKLLPTIKDAKKRYETELKIKDLEIKINEEKLKANLDAAKSEIDNMLNSLDLHTKLKDLGLGEGEIQSMFGPLETNLDNIKEKVLEVFEAKTGKKRGTNGEGWGTDYEKAYQEYLEKVNKKITDDQLKQFEELVKAYKKQIDGQLAIDRDYAKQRNAILTNSNLNNNKEYQQALLQAADEDYAKKSNSQAWKDFQDSGMYTMVFDNLETQSTRVLNMMLEKLQSLRESLKDLSPEELKAIADQEHKIQDTIANKNPFKGLIADIKEYNQFLRKREDIENEIANTDSNIDSLKATVTLWDKANNRAQARVKLAKEQYGLESEEYKNAQKQASQTQNMLNNAQEKLNTEKATLSNLLKQYKAGKDVGDLIVKKTQAIQDEINATASSVNSIMEAAGSSDEDMNRLVTALGSVLAAVIAINVASAANPYMAILSAITAVGTLVAGLFNNDDDIQEEMDNIQRKIDELSRAYDKLKESMDNAWDSSSLVEYKNETIENMQLQIKEYEHLIKLEQDKKNSDKSKIQEYKNDILDLEDSIKEATESMTEALGGFGSESNYKSAAQEFADAWVDAFNEGEDTLAALNDTMDDFFENLIKKQLMNRLVKKRMQGVLEAIDEAVSEGSEGGNSGTDVTSEELARIKELYTQAGAALNEDMKNLADVLNYTSSSGSSLSALQKGIEGVTETTAEAIEAYMNVIKFDVAQQTTDVTAIRTLLENTLGTSGDDSMLRELKSQTSYLKSIDSRLDYVIKAGHNKGGYGIKVFTE